MLPAGAAPQPVILNLDHHVLDSPHHLLELVLVGFHYSFHVPLQLQVHRLDRLQHRLAQGLNQEHNVRIVPQHLVESIGTESMGLGLNFQQLYCSN